MRNKYSFCFVCQFASTVPARDGLIGGGIFRFYNSYGLLVIYEPKVSVVNYNLQLRDVKILKSSQLFKKNDSNFRS